MSSQEERVNYQTLKSWALDTYFDGCRDLAMMRKWPHEQILGYVSYTFEEGFERPVEDLMWKVIIFILSGGWHPDWESRARQVISDQIKAHGLDSILTDVPEEEAELFKHDLRILNII